MRSWQALRSVPEPVCTRVAQGVGSWARSVHQPPHTIRFSEAGVGTRVGVRGKLPVT